MWSDFTSLFFLSTLFTGLTCINLAAEEDSNYWMRLGRNSIEDALKLQKIEGRAKNAILFVGDGMGMTTITAGRIFKGQLEGKPGEEGYLSFEKFPHLGLAKTYNVDRQVPDSAGTATALFSGVKGNYYTVGLDSRAITDKCDPTIEAKSKVSTLLDWAIAAGKSTGLVTTTRITHATPSAAYGHSPHRDWECDSTIPERERNKGCKDLGRQLVEDEPGKNINVILGGGAQVLRHSIKDSKSGACQRNDSRDLIWDWMETQKQSGRKYKFVKDKKQLMSVDGDTNYILGLFANGHMPYDKDRDTGETGQPSLTEMVNKTIDVLSRNPNGYILIVEGGRIDHAHHDNLAKIALEEVVAFDSAIEFARNKVNIEETLIIVTADHSHSMSINGYPLRGAPIEGVGSATPEGFSYQTLSYINGPGYNYHRVLSSPALDANETLTSVNTWKNLNDSSIEELHNRSLPHQAMFWMDYETHGGEDVPIYALGPMAHLFHGVHEQTHVPFTIAYSTCIGPYHGKCKVPTKKNPVRMSSNMALQSSPSQVLVLMMVVFGMALMTSPFH